MAPGSHPYRPGGGPPRPNCWTSWCWNGCWPSSRPPLPTGTQAVGSRIKQEATVAWKSTIWRRFVAATERAWRSCWPLTSAAWTWSRAWWTVPSRRALLRGGVGITLDGTKAPSGWARARPSTPRSWGACSPGCATAGWTSPADPGRHRRRQGAAPRRQRYVRPSGCPTLSESGRGQSRPKATHGEPAS
jgi:hypothetical protein